jgi:hypothetical protein
VGSTTGFDNWTAKERSRETSSSPNEAVEAFAGKTNWTEVTTIGNVEATVTFNSSM